MGGEGRGWDTSGVEGEGRGQDASVVDVQYCCIHFSSEHCCDNNS